ncbi:MAG TPA: Calx-beta domain-containing protein [Candidatus Sulfotelmatobacter sp.]|nr:Calx-beta domain-containing protein [Candidatus Sulfotelmatobacter sp.]
MRLRICLATTCFLWFSAFTYGLTPQTFLTLISQPGDYIGQGITQTFTPADGTFSVSNTSNTVSVSFHNADYSQFWSLNFATPNKFGGGEFDSAQRASFRSPTRPGIDVWGDGRGCNTDTGRFLVSNFALNTDGTIAHLAIDFEQHCEGGTPALYGSVRYNSAVTAIPRLGIASTYTLKGNAGLSDSSVTVALSLPGANVVQVAYATADGTAVQGTDYVNTTGVLTFEPGVTAQTITVPIIGDFLPRGGKTFKVKLSGASGAPISVAGASVVVRDPNVPMTVLAMSSQPGDYIGQGLQYLITSSDGTITPSNSGNLVAFNINNGDGWTTDFAGPTTARLARGDYENAQRYPFQPAGTPGLDVSGDGRGCNTLTGNFQVLLASYNTSSVLQGFSANFEQHCEGMSAALFGWLRYNTKLQQFSVTDAVINGDSASFTVTLSPAGATSLAVNFATADGTAISGTDYVATSQSVTFSPGMTQQTVTVPLLNPSASSKTFYGKLTSPGGAPVWIGTGSATF